ncbi:hypothetical protein L5515_017941 [Caenorhabditis briggsae]|uniref:EB domain-containing protein n=1 Tax=Caenorhabditis briggsae TaxID=6238 RepID=A0AAE9JRZ0_CAEBR|nr:hypothetical protein L3Y34_012081 [Caenorhabditis briggsae]UMM41875.1 hypothetical protein L5515_017941 [Caenorhabditis briggsae]
MVVPHIFSISIFLAIFIQKSFGGDAKVGVPGTECLFGGICSGGSICIDVLCLCVDGEREFEGQCVEKSVYDSRIKESESFQDDKLEQLPAIGLAGHPCGQGGVCRPSTKCIEGTCKCRQGYNPSFGECVRDLNVPRHIPRAFIPNHRSILRFPS